MKLVLLTANYPYGDGGDNYFIKNEIDDLSRKFDDISIVSTCNAPLTKELPKNVVCSTVDIHAVSFWDAFFALFATISGFFKTFFETKKFCKQEGALSILLEIFKYEVTYRKLRTVLAKELSSCDVVYSYWMSARLYAALRVIKKRRLKCKVCTRAHGYDLYCFRNPLPYRTFIGNNVKEIIFISKDGLDYYKKLIYPSLKNKCHLYLSYLGLNKEAEPKPLIPHESLNIVSCSNVIQLKRLDIIVDALSEIKDIPIRWTHIGDGPMLDFIKKRAREKLGNLGNIHYRFLGRMANEEIFEFYRNGSFDLFINCSDTEGLPVSVMEAFSFGIPAITRDVGGVSEINRLPKGLFLLEGCSDYRTFANVLVEFYNLNEMDKARYRAEAASIFERYFSRRNLSSFADHISRL